VNGLFRNIVTGVVRHIVNGAGAALMADGYLTMDQEVAIIGGIMAVVAVVWSMADKHKAAAKLDAAQGTIVSGLY
jgi:hypothetical protein